MYFTAIHAYVCSYACSASRTAVYMYSCVRTRGAEFMAAMGALGSLLYTTTIARGSPVCYQPN